MKIGRAIAFLALAGIAGFAVYRYREAAEKKETKQKGRPKAAVVVNMVMPERRNLPYTCGERDGPGLSERP